MERMPSDRAMARFVIRHRRPSLWRLAAPTALALVLGASVILNGGADEWPILMIILLGAILLPFVIFGLLSRPVPDQWMEVRPRSLVLPATSFGSEAIEVPIAQVRSIYARLTRDGNVWIETSFRTFSFPLHAFDSPASAALLVDRVRECIRSLPDGEERIAVIDRDARIAERALSTKHAATISAVALLVAAALVVHFEAAQWTFGLVRFGANIDFLVEQGERHRLIASLFVHAGPVHLGFVVFGIASAGAIVERLLGSTGAVLIMLASGIAGTAAMHLGSGFYSVGASPIVFGLMGAAAFITQHHRDRIPMLLRPTLGLWILIGAFTLPMTLIGEVDFSANVGGLLAGVIIGALLASDENGLPLRGLRPRWAVGAIGVVGAAYVYGLAAGAIAWDEHTRETDTRVMERFIQLDREGYDGLNKLAWEVALDPESTSHQLELAEIAAKRSVDRSPEAHVTGIEDTLATVWYRQGRFREAAALEKSVFERDAKAVYASQLAVFLKAHAATSTATYPVKARLADGTVELSAAEPLSEDAAVYLVALEGDEARGLITLPLKAGEPKATLELTEVETTSVAIGWIDRRKTVPAGAWKISPEAPKLP